MQFGHINGIVGPVGSGKSFVAITLACQLAEEFQYDLCFNFALDARGLYRYFAASGFYWLIHRLYRGGVQVKPVSFGSKVFLDDWMDKRKTLYVLDEAGIFLNSRRFASTPPQFLADLAQIRHDGRRLFWIAQFADQVDRQLRELTTHFVWCNCLTRYSRRLGSSEMVYKNYRLFESRNFKIFSQKVDGAKNGFKFWAVTSRLALRSWGGRLNDVDRLLFSLYPSLERIEEEPCLVNPIYPPKVLEVTYDEQTFSRSFSRSAVSISRSKLPQAS